MLFHDFAIQMGDGAAQHRSARRFDVIFHAFELPLPDFACEAFRERTLIAGKKIDAENLRR